MEAPCCLKDGICDLGFNKLQLQRKAETAKCELSTSHKVGSCQYMHGL